MLKTTDLSFFGPEIDVPVSQFGVDKDFCIVRRNALGAEHKTICVNKRDCDNCEVPKQFGAKRNKNGSWEMRPAETPRQAAERMCRDARRDKI